MCKFDKIRVNEYLKICLHYFIKIQYYSYKFFFHLLGKNIYYIQPNYVKKCNMY